MHFHGLVISHHPGSCLVLFFDDCSTSVLDPRCFSGEWGRKHGQVKHSESWGGGGDSISRCQARCDDGPQTQRRKKKGLGVPSARHAATLKWRACHVHRPGACSLQSLPKTDYLPVLRAATSFFFHLWFCQYLRDGVYQDIYIYIYMYTCIYI